MKIQRRIIIWSLISVILASVLFMSLPQATLAQTPNLIDPACKITDNEKAIKINFKLPGITQVITRDGDTFEAVKSLPCFIIGIYVYFAGVAGILATVMIMYGGIKYVTSFGNQTRVASAKDTIFSALVGLVLALGAYVLLSFINPNLVEFKLTVSTVSPDLGIIHCDDYGNNVEPVDPNKPRTCPNKGIIQGGDEDGAECFYGCPGENEYCLPGTEENPYDFKSAHCGNAEKECNEWQASGDIQDDEVKLRCPSYSSYVAGNPEISGRCQWIGRPATTCPFGNYDEGCHYFKQLDCEIKLGEGWERAGCQECVANLTSVEDKNCSFSSGLGVYLCDINEIGDESFNVIQKADCSSSQDDKAVYQFDRGNSDRVNEETWSAICCKKGTEYKYLCEMEDWRDI